MTVMSLDDGNDADIVLEEVSKIFRCKDCLRCFISFTKFSEHFPVYHPEKISAINDDHRTSKRGPRIILPPTATHACGEKEIPEGTVNNGNSTVVPRRPKISLRQNKETSFNDANVESESDNTTSLNQRKFVKALNLDPVLKDVNGIQENGNQSFISSQNNDENKDRNTEHVDHSEQEASRVQNTVSGSEMDRSASEDTGVEQISFVESRSRKEVEVITLSDSDDDDETNIRSNIDDGIRETVVRLKQEVDCDQVDNPTVSLGKEHVPDNTTNDAQDELPVTEEEKGQCSLLPRKKYLCQYCNKLFTRDRTLHSHLRGMHREAYEKDEFEKNVRNNGNSSTENGSEGGKGRGSSSSKPGYSNGTGNGLVNGNGKRSGGKNDHGKGKKKQKRRKSLPSTDMGEQSTLPKETTVETMSVGGEEKDTQMLAFSCKWCPEKFLQLDSLKQHAINVHIKYKQME